MLHIGDVTWMLDIGGDSNTAAVNYCFWFDTRNGFEQFRFLVSLTLFQYPGGKMATIQEKVKFTEMETRKKLDAL